LSGLGTSECIVNQVTVADNTLGILGSAKFVSVVNGWLIESLYVTYGTVSFYQKADHTAGVIFFVTV
jgi:hypothetical protein